MIFISHSHSELDVAKQLEGHLLAIGCRSWLDASQIPVGERFVRAIGAALSQSSAIVFIDSERSRSSYWCHRERLAGMRLRDTGRVRCLIALQPRPVAGNPRFSPDHLTTTVADAASLACALQRDQTSLVSVGDVHSVAIEELHVPPEPAVWLGFSDALATLDEWWLSRETGCWVTGVGGGGKTSLVLTWLRALEFIGYRDALQLGCITWSFYDDPSPSHALDRIRAWLQTASYPSRLVFWDGVERLSDVGLSELLRFTREHWEAKFIVTSRTMPPIRLTDRIRTLSLAALSTRDACMLLEKNGLSHTTAQRITNSLDGHPLAIALASAGIKGGAFSADDVLRMVETAGNPVSPPVHEEFNG